MKMLTTQMSGLLQRAAAANEEAVEETARLLAQAAIGEGRVIFRGIGDMEIIGSYAVSSAEPFYKAVMYEPGMVITSADRVFLLTRSAGEETALTFARELSDRFIPFAAMAAEKDDRDNELADLAHTYLATGVTRGILPADDGSRIVQPHGIAALFLYEAVKISYDEMVADE